MLKVDIIKNNSVTLLVFYFIYMVMVMINVTPVTYKYNEYLYLRKLHLLLYCMFIDSDGVTSSLRAAEPLKLIELLEYGLFALLGPSSLSDVSFLISTSHIFCDTFGLQ